MANDKDEEKLTKQQQIERMFREASEYTQAPTRVPVVHAGPFLTTTGEFVFSGRPDAEEVDTLKKELAATTDQITAVWNQVAGLQAQLTKNAQTEQNQAIQAEVAAIAQTVSQVQTQLTQAQRQTEGLTAPIVMPTPEDMQIRLVPTHWLERLEEYRADEANAKAIALLFCGAILGILINWATSEQFIVTRFSVVLILLFGLLAAGLGRWVARVRQRATLMRDRMLRFTDVQQMTAPRTDQNQPSPPAP